MSWSAIAVIRWLRASIFNKRHTLCFYHQLIGYVTVWLDMYLFDWICISFIGYVHDILDMFYWMAVDEVSCCNIVLQENWIRKICSTFYKPTFHRTTSGNHAGWLWDKFSKVELLLLYKASLEQKISTNFDNMRFVAHNLLVSLWMPVWKILLI